MDDERERSDENSQSGFGGSAPSSAPEAPAPEPDQPEEETSDEAPAESSAPAGNGGRPVKDVPLPADQPGVWPGEAVEVEARSGPAPAIRSSERANGSGAGRNGRLAKMQARREARAEQEAAAQDNSDEE